MSWLDPCKIRRITIVGSKKMIVYDDIEPVDKVKIYNKGVDVQPYTDTYEDFQLAYRYGDVINYPLKWDEPLKSEIRLAWDEVLNGMHLFLGPNVQALEKEFASYCGTAYAIGVSEGTTAVNLALRACNIGPGDEVITVSHTFIATVEAIVLTGARPVFVDIDPRTCLMDVSQVEGRITAKTRAILPVHLYGQCVDMDPVLEIARQHHLYVIEDACQAHGASYKGHRAGSMGSFGAFSF